MKLIYVGESPGRVIPYPGGVLTVEHGIPFEVDDDLGAALLAQPIFTPAPKGKTKENS